MVLSPGFAILDHPADLGIEAYGRTLAESFEQAAVGLMSVILDLTSVATVEAKQVYLNAVDIEQLLVKWLSEVLYFYDGQGFVAVRFSISHISPDSLLATILGEKFSEERHLTRLDVKAITYHQLSVHQDEDAYRVRVFLDI
jgi:SHS2 domain-containing protein